MQAMLDTCIVIDFEDHHPKLPANLEISAVVFAELSSGAATAPTSEERETRVARLRWARTFFDPDPFGQEAADEYGRMVAALRRIGRNERSRVADLMIAATAAANRVPLYTNNADDFLGLDQLVEVIVI
jgi:predicted nucleic acid-binding protein